MSDTGHRDDLLSNDHSEGRLEQDDPFFPEEHDEPDDFKNEISQEEPAKREEQKIENASPSKQKQDRSNKDAQDQSEQGERKSHSQKEGEKSRDTPDQDSSHRKNDNHNGHGKNSSRTNHRVEHSQNLDYQSRLTYRKDKETEYLVHFYIKNISNSHSKHDLSKKLHKNLSKYGKVREIACQKDDGDVFSFAVGMLYDNNASYIVNHDILRIFVSTVTKSHAKTYVDVSKAFYAANKALRDTDPSKTDREREREKERERERDRERERERERDREREDREREREREEREREREREKERERDREREREREREKERERERERDREREREKEKERLREKDREREREREKERGYDRPRDYERDRPREELTVRRPGDIHERSGRSGSNSQIKDKNRDIDHRDDRNRDRKYPDKDAEKERERERERDRDRERERGRDYENRKERRSPSPRQGFTRTANQKRSKSRSPRNMDKRREFGNDRQEERKETKPLEISGPVNVQQYPGARGTDNVLSVTKRVDNVGIQNPVVQDPRPVLVPVQTITPMEPIIPQIPQPQPQIQAQIQQQPQPQIQQQPPVSSIPMKRTNSITAQQKEFHYNWCLLLGIPKEFTEQDIINSMRSQGLEPPQSFEWVDEGPIQYLKAYFNPTIHAFNLIIQDFKVGHNAQTLIYPVLILPWAENLPVSYTLPQHQIRIESAADVDNSFLYQWYKGYGDIVDIIEVSSRVHIIIFTKQPKASAVLQMERTVLKNQNGESIPVSHLRADAQYPVTRKNIRYTLEGLKVNIQAPVQQTFNLKPQKPEIRLPQQQQQGVGSKPSIQIQTQPSQNRPGQDRLVIQTQSHIQAQLQAQAQEQQQAPKVFKTERYENQGNQAFETRNYDNSTQNKGYVDERIYEQKQQQQQPSNPRDDRYNDDRNRDPRDNRDNRDRERDNYYKNNNNNQNRGYNRNNNQSNRDNSGGGQNRNQNRNYRNSGPKQNNYN